MSLAEFWFCWMQKVVGKAQGSTPRRPPSKSGIKSTSCLAKTTLVWTKCPSSKPRILVAYVPQRRNQKYRLRVIQGLSLVHKVVSLTNERLLVTFLMHLELALLLQVISLSDTVLLLLHLQCCNTSKNLICLT